MRIILKTVAAIAVCSILQVNAQQRSASSPKVVTINKSTLNSLAENSAAIANEALKSVRAGLENTRTTNNVRQNSFRNFNANENCDCNDDKIDIKDLKTKEVSMELPATKGGDVFIESSSRTIEIKTWEQAKVKVTTTIYYEGDANKLSDEEWFEKLNLAVKTLGNSIIVKSGTVGSGSYSYGNESFAWSSGGTSGVAIFDGNGKNIGTKSSLKRIVTIYVPTANKIDIDTKYSDVNVGNGANKISLNITNGNAEIGDVNTLILRSKYSNVSCGDVKTGEIEFINGRFIAKNCNELDVDTKYSTFEVGSVKKINIKSTNDEYEIDEVSSFQGRKSYGNLRITNLTNSFELDGTNADIKIRNVAAAVNAIRIDNKYADIRLPMREVKNYTIKYNGPWSTIYGNFEKQPLPTETADEKKKNAETGDALADQIRRIEGSVRNAFTNKEDELNNKFMAVVGTGKGALLNIKCQNCTVDFK
jgi:hypothetical protein